MLLSQNWHFLSKHIQYHSIVAAGAVEETAEVETRDRHSLVSLTNPNEVDEEDERHLRDEQVRPLTPNPNPNPNPDPTPTPTPTSTPTATLTRTRCTWRLRCERAPSPNTCPN